MSWLFTDQHNWIHIARPECPKAELFFSQVVSCGKGITVFAQTEALQKEKAASEQAYQAEQEAKQLAQQETEELRQQLDTQGISLEQER